MNISYSWLKEYISVNLTPAEISEILTGIGLEVEAVESLDKVKGGFEGLVVGEVVTCVKHPDADKLSLTTVNTGKAEHLQIVCGAPNVAAGQKVVVALVGTTLYKNEEPFRINKAKIRGILSEGMICAEDEIGLSDNHNGIIVLPDDAPVGMEVKKYYGAEPEIMFTIGLTPNRIDSASHFGVARDLAAYLSKTGKIELRKPGVSGFRVENEDYPVTVAIENPDACPRYAGVSISGLQVKPSPDWLQNRLRSIGMNPINNIVDVTNFVLHELGQPLHAFDADELAGRKIIVKNLPEGTPFVTLDGVERRLSAEDLMICDGEKAVAIGGVFGGLHSGVTGKTKNIFIESAYFNPVSVRKTSKRLAINTDASFRFERGIDPEMTIFALKRCALLIKEVAGGTISSSVIDVYPRPMKPVSVEVRYEHIQNLIGKIIEKEVIKSVLLSLDFIIEKENADGMSLLVPQYRVDVTREADVIEEILRIYGYNNIEISGNLHASLSYSPRPDNEKLVNMVSDYLTGNGFHEIMCNSLTNSDYYKSLTTFSPDHLVRIKNPLSNELNVMRQTLLFGGLEVIRHNTNRQRPDLRLFEFGNCYVFDESKRDNKEPLKKYNESRTLALFITGNKFEPNWISPLSKSSFYELKAYLMNVFDKMGIDEQQLKTEIISPNNDLYSGGIIYSMKGMKVGEAGIISRDILNNFDIRDDVFYGVINWQELVKLRGDHRIYYTELAKFPEVRRDLALLVDKDVTFARVRETALKTENKLLKHIDLFDVYEGEQIEKGKKSYAVSFRLQDISATLTDKRIDEVMTRLMKAFTHQLGAVIR